MLKSVDLSQDCYSVSWFKEYIDVVSKERNESHLQVSRLVINAHCDSLNSYDLSIIIQRVNKAVLDLII